MHAVRTIYLEILVGIKFGGWAPNHHFKKNIGRFKFGSSARDWHAYYNIMQALILVDFNLVVDFLAIQ